MQNSKHNVIPIAPIEDVRRVRRMAITIGERRILILALEDTIVALDPTCPHWHVPSLEQGICQQDSITCPNHGWTFSLRSGKALRGSGRIRLYSVLIADGMLCIELPDETPRWMQY
ncbi:MAG: Rieske 2Fe-2S domain-containing protein [Chlorobi bacterium]|nr:Rieske 2Fe-2S domain-containing protein [Chlorobiota bacterium]